jgi:serine/threonine-protein kinase RsbW
LEQLLPVAHNLDEALEILGGAANRSASNRLSPAATADRVGRERATSGLSVPPVRAGEITLAIENKLAELKGLQAKVAEFLADHGVTGRAAYAVDLAIDELVVNVMRYAYVDDDTHVIELQLAIDGKQVMLRIVDDGRPFDPRRGPALDFHAEDREVGGLGLVLVLDMVDVLKYRRVDDKNCVEVRVHLTTNVAGDDLTPGD